MPAARYLTAVAVTLATALLAGCGDSAGKYSAADHHYSGPEHDRSAIDHANQL